MRLSTFFVIAPLTRRYLRSENADNILASIVTSASSSKQFPTFGAVCWSLISKAPNDTGMKWVIVIPKGRAHKAAPALLLVWWLFKKKKKKKKLKKRNFFFFLYDTDFSTKKKFEKKKYREKKKKKFGVMPKEGRARPPVLLLVWQQLRKLETFSLFVYRSPYLC